MTPLNNNGSGTLKSQTLEGQLWELTALHTKWQKSNTTNPANVKYVSWSITGSGDAMSAQYEFPAEQTFSNTGQIVHEAKEYLTGTNFVASTSEVKSTTPTKYLVELLFLLQKAESDPTKNPTNLNNVSAGFPVDTDVFSGSATLNLLDLDDGLGNPAFSAKVYLG